MTEKAIALVSRPGLDQSDYEALATKSLGTKRPTAAEFGPDAIFHAAGVGGESLIVLYLWEDKEALEDFILGRIALASKDLGLPPMAITWLTPHNIYLGEGAGTTGVLFESMPGVTLVQYDELMGQLFGGLEIGDDTPKGLVSHIAAKSEDGLFVFDVWESAEDFQRFASEKLMPAAIKVGLPELEPKVFGLINVATRKRVMATA